AVHPTATETQGDTSPRSRWRPLVPGSSAGPAVQASTDPPSADLPPQTGPAAARRVPTGSPQWPLKSGAAAAGVSAGGEDSAPSTGGGGGVPQTGAPCLGERGDTGRGRPPASALSSQGPRPAGSRASAPRHRARDTRRCAGNRGNPDTLSAYTPLPRDGLSARGPDAICQSRPRHSGRRPDRYRL